jgi:hypothetical protein
MGYILLFGQFVHSERCSAGLRLLLVVAQASTLAVSALFALGFVAMPLVLEPASPRSLQAAAAVLALLLPGGVAGWYIFRKLCRYYPRSEARTMAKSFGGFNPILSILSMILAEIPGGYAGSGGRLFGLVGAFLGVVFVTTVLSFLVTLLALWTTRCTERTNAAP